MFEHWYVIDPGAYSIKFLDVRGKKRMALRSSIAYQGKEVVAISKDAFQYIYEPNKRIRIKNVLNHNQMLNPMHPILTKGFTLLESNKNIFKPGVILLTPSEFEDAQKDIWQNEMHQAGVQKVVFRSVMEASKLQESGIVIHMGHSYSEIGFFFKGNLVFQKTLYFAGKQMDEEIQSIVLKKTQCLISEEDACSLKEKASRSLMGGNLEPVQCYGYNKYQQFVVLNMDPIELWPAMEHVIGQIALWTKDELNRIDSKKRLAIQQGGMYLSGGLAECYGVCSILAKELHMVCKVVNQPAWDVVERVKGWK
ncbi:MAG: rod shape-determining protein [Bacillota bacterium]|nr:rod shape-determining protein [Bacillota bacterium]